MSREPRVRKATYGGVSGDLHRKLGEDLAAMLTKVGRKVYAAAMERTRKAIADSLLANRGLLTASLRNEFGRRGSKTAKAAVSEWLDEIVGEVLTDVAEEVYNDIPEITKALMDQARAAEDEEGPPAEEEEELPEGDGEEEPEEEMVEMGEDEESETPPAESTEELANIAEELEEIKAAGLAQAARLAQAGDVDSAAHLRMIMKQL
jgi:hypothetical protein